MSFKSTAWPRIITGIYSVFIVLMLGITFQYIPINTDVAFLRIKQDYIHLPFYRIAFFAHVFSSVFLLFAGFSQFSKRLLLKYPSYHRLLGYAYVVLILGLSAPSGLLIGLFANGGPVSQLSFCFLALLWWIFTYKALIYARKKNFLLHRQYMIRSFALTLSAITLRAWKYILVAVFHPHPMDAYRVVAILGWTLNLLVAEIYIHKFTRK